MKIFCTIFFILTTILINILNATEPDRLEQIMTSRGVGYSIWIMQTNNAKATLVLFPGGGGGFGYDKELNQPNSRNFLVRGRDFFRNAGYNVIIVGKPEDKKELDYNYRISEEHISDIKSILQEAHKLSNSLPVYIIGTSRGTISATAATINIPDLIQGMILTSSIVNYKKTGAVPNQKLESIHVPLLVVHHSNDQCSQCNPSQVNSIIDSAKNSPIKQLIMVEGGENLASGDPCEALHNHGFIGIEEQTVKIITDWIDKSLTK